MTLILFFSSTVERTREKCETSHKENKENDKDEDRYSRINISFINFYLSILVHKKNKFILDMINMTMNFV